MAIDLQFAWLIVRKPMRLALAFSALLVSGFCRAQDWQGLGLDSASLSCKDQIVLKSSMHDGFYKGLALMSLKTGVIKWEAVANETTVMQPVVSGDVVAVVTPHSHTISAFAMPTGQRLWQKEAYTQILDSDGKHFYVLSNNPVVEAVDPKTGKTIWSRKVPYSGYLIDSYHIRNHRLYTPEFVLDVAKRQVVHRWPAKPLISAMAFDRNGRIYAGDIYGVVRIYSPHFKLLREIHVGLGEIVELEVPESGFLAASYEYHSHSIYHAVFKVLTQQGHTRWQVVAHSPQKLGGPAFVIAGRQVVLIEREANKDKYWMTSRDLSTGRVNWRAHPGSYPEYFNEPMAVCADTLYVSNGPAIYGFDLNSGKEKMISKQAD